MKFDESILVRELSHLSEDRVISFAAACSDRLVLSTVIREGSTAIPSLLSDASEAIWEGIRGHFRKDTESLEDQLLDAIPNEDDESSFDAAVIEDTCAALVYALRSLRGQAAQNAAYAARRAYETADRYASQFINEIEYSGAAESQILNHPVVQQELQRQARDLQVITSGSNASFDLTLKQMGRGEAVLIVR